MHFRPWLIYLVIAFLGVLPVLLALLAGAVANCAKCQLNEASYGPCVIAGVDVGKLLYTFCVGGWFSLMTLPAAVTAALIYSIYLLVRR